MSKSIPGNSVEAGLKICKQLGIDPSIVLSIDIFALHGTLVVTTLHGKVNCHLVTMDNGNLLIVKD